jgi:hypothetical protein
MGLVLTKAELAAPRNKPRHDHCLGLAGGDKVEHRRGRVGSASRWPVSLAAVVAPALLPMSPATTLTFASPPSGLHPHAVVPTARKTPLAGYVVQSANLAATPLGQLSVSPEFLLRSLCNRPGRRCQARRRSKLSKCLHRRTPFRYRHGLKQQPLALDCPKCGRRFA